MSRKLGEGFSVTAAFTRLFSDGHKKSEALSKASSGALIALVRLLSSLNPLV